MNLLALGLCAALSLVAAVAAIFAAVWARSGAQAVDGFAAIVIPLLARVKHKVDPDPTVATVVAAAAAAPPPAIVEPPAELLVSAAPLPRILVEEDEDPRESAPCVEPDEHSPTIPMEVPRAHAAPPEAMRNTDARGEWTGAEGKLDEADAHWASDAAPLIAELRPVEPPETGPSRSGERARDDGEQRPAGYFAPYVVPAEPPAPDTLPPSSTIHEAPGGADALANRRARAHRLGQATQLQRQVDARKAREAEEVHRQVQPLTEEEAARPSGEGFAMDRASWEGRTAVYDKAQVDAALGGAVPLARVVPVARVVPAGAALGRGEGPGKPRPKQDSAPTLASAGVEPRARARHDPRVEPETGTSR